MYTCILCTSHYNEIKLCTRWLVPPRKPSSHWHSFVFVFLSKCIFVNGLPIISPSEMTLLVQRSVLWIAVISLGKPSYIPSAWLLNIPSPMTTTTTNERDSCGINIKKKNFSFSFHYISLEMCVIFIRLSVMIKFALLQFNEVFFFM